MSTDLDILCFTVSFIIPSVHLLSVVIGVGGWGYPRLESVSRNVSTSFVLWKSAPSSASTVDDMMFFIMEERTWIALFVVGRDKFAG